MATSAANAFWKENRPKLIDMIGRGKNSGYIASALGCSLSQVCNQIASLRRCGAIDIPPAANAKVSFTAEMDAALVAAVSSGKPFKEHAAAIGISATVVQRRAADLGLKSSHNVDIDWSVLKPKIKAMREANTSWRSIGSALCIAETTARRVGCEMGLSVNLPREARADVRWTVKAQNDLVAMLDAGKSISEIADALGSTRGAVSSRIKMLRRIGRLPPVSSEKKKAQREAARKQALAVIAARPKSAKPPKIAKTPRAPRAAKITTAPVPKPVKPVREPVEHLVGFDRIQASFVSSPGRGVSLFDLPAPELRSVCRWPFVCDDGETRYCGASATDSGWCAGHGPRVFASAKRPTTDAYSPRQSGRGFAMQREARA